MRISPWKPLIMRILPVLAALAAASGAQAQAGLIQERMNRSLDLAERLIAQGRSAEAGAHLDLVLHSAPIRCSVDDSALPDSRRSSARAALEEAFAMWSREMPGVRFVLSESAEVRIRLVPEILRQGGSAGFAEWRRGVYPDGRGGFGASLSGEVQVAWNPAQSAMVQAAAHELGHLLGLADGPAGGVMGPVYAHRPVLRPSEAEADALLSLRLEAWTRALHAGIRLPSSGVEA
jgi:hypothetical protein